MTLATLIYLLLGWLVYILASYVVWRIDPPISVRDVVAAAYGAVAMFSLLHNIAIIITVVACHMAIWQIDKWLLNRQPRDSENL